MNAHLRWHAPTHNLDGTPLAGPLTYDVYQFVAHHLTEPVVPILRGLTATSVVVPNLSPHTEVCFTVRAYVRGAASRISNIACQYVRV